MPLTQVFNAMHDALRAYMQYLLPQHLLSRFAGKLANAKTPWLKDWIIKRFVRKYHIDMQDAVVTEPTAYASFNEFFIRKLNPSTRPLAMQQHAVTSPADGTIAQIGNATQHQLLQAKNFDFTLEALFGDDKKTARYFDHGAYATIYLAPNNYHRVHMPIDGRLERTIYIPGKLFSVNQITAAHIPNLYSRNERFIAVFDTHIGKMAVIMVGAMIVGSIQPSWMQQAVRGKQISTVHFTQQRTLQKGDEIGYFNLGSTVIILFEKNKIAWNAALTVGSTVKYGEMIAKS